LHSTAFDRCSYINSSSDARDTLDYCSENATEAVQLTLDVVMTAIAYPLAPDLVAWSEQMSAVADHLERADADSTTGPPPT